MIFIKNNTQEEQTWLGKVFSAGEYRQLDEFEKSRWSSSSTVLSSLSTQDMLVARDDSGSEDITDLNEAINYLKGLLPPQVYSQSYAFSDKTTNKGKRVFTRLVGVKQAVGSSPEDIEFTVPYDFCKITGIEVVNADIGDKADLKVYDTPTGTISGTPGALLNQFGDGVYMAKDHYRYESRYDADLIKDMKLVVTYDGDNSLLPKTVYINFILHELK